MLTPPTPVGSLDRPPSESRYKPITQKNAAEAAIDPCLSASVAEWEAAFPGQHVHRGMPNHVRRAMHLARALVRAEERGDYELAASLLLAFYRAAQGWHQQ